jgi:predicted Zn-dependent peptidase
LHRSDPIYITVNRLRQFPLKDIDHLRLYGDQIDTKNGRTRNMAFYENIGYGYKSPYKLIDELDKVTIDEVNDFVRANLSKENQYLAIVGKR